LCRRRKPPRLKRSSVYRVYPPYSITVDTAVTITVLLVGRTGLREKGRGKGKPKGREKKDLYQHCGNALMTIPGPINAANTARLVGRMLLLLYRFECAVHCVADVALQMMFAFCGVRIEVLTPKWIPEKQQLSRLIRAFCD
jgi:hypothetical protein